MNRRKRKRLYRDAVERWGVLTQLDMLVEECAELIQAVNKVKRNATPDTWADVAGEMADVHIMMEQLMLCGELNNLEELFMEAEQEKLDRLQQTLDALDEVSEHH